MNLNLLFLQFGWKQRRFAECQGLDEVKEKADELLRDSDSMKKAY